MNVTLIILIIVLLSILAVPLSLRRLMNKNGVGKADRLPGFDMSGEDEHRSLLESRAGYAIEVDEAIPEGAGRIIIAIHGFGGSKASNAITLMQRVATAKGIGLVKFDWPAHGRSRAKDADYTVTNCLNDLDTVLQHVRSMYPDAKLIAFPNSFGGYITMLYYADHQQAFDRIILRSPALRFGKLLIDGINQAGAQKQVEEDGGFETGFDRKIFVTTEMIREANERRVEDIYEDPKDWDLSRITMIHGTADEVVPYEDSVNFSEKHGIELHTVEGADHRYTGEGQLEEAVAFAAGVIDRDEE